MKKLMEERRVTRFLIAPTGFGKTSLAAEYADSIFGFRNVFWLDCQSPCFLRDLDAGSIVSGLKTQGSSGSLVVFDDVPYLDDERAEAFSSALDGLLSEDWEAVVSMLPPYDAFAERQPDRVVVNALDFLVDDAELEALGGAVEGSSLREQDRVCALVWGSDADRDAFLGSLKAAELPAEMRLAMLSALVLQKGTFEDLGALVRGMKRDTYRFFARHYPHLGLDLVSEEFDAVEVSVERISRIFSSTIEGVMDRASTSGRDALSIRFADLLADRGFYHRACETVKSLCARKRRLAWISRMHPAFVSAGQVEPLQDLFEGLGKRLSGLDPSSALDAAVRLVLLGDASRSALFSARAMGHPDAVLRTRCEAALLYDEYGGGDCAPKAAAVLEKAASHFHSAGVDGDLGVAGCVAASRIALPSDPMAAVAVLRPHEAAMAASDAGMAHLVFLLACSKGAVVRDGWTPWSRDAREAAKAMAVRCIVTRRESRLECGAFHALAANELALSPGGKGSGEEWSDATGDAMASLLLQRERWARRRRLEGAAMRGEAAFRRGGRGQEDRVPEMHVRMFGGMEVSIGGRPLAPGAFKKQKAKTLLAVLVLRRGKEVPRRELLDIMWPASEWERAVSNFYSLWSVLRKALSDEQGRCPYLVRHQSSCMIDARHVRSDVEEFESLYRRLMFDPPDASTWLGVFERLSEDFFCDLMPSETDNLYIDGMRERYRARTVDACATAAMRLCDIDEAQTALWFAHAALDLDGGREDVYYALMRAQLMSGRRTSAMETYFACLRYMGNELGIGLSERMVRLYEELIACPDGD